MKVKIVRMDSERNVQLLPAFLPLTLNEKQLTSCQIQDYAEAFSTLTSKEDFLRRL